MFLHKQSRCSNASSNLQDLWTVDHAVGFDKGAALVDTYATALIGLHRRAKVHEGSTVLVTAAAGGLGLAAVDLAASVYKAKVCVCQIVNYSQKL